MNHLDDGTIHAWLDGALEAARARDVEAHVRACASCAAAVAEARGLIAASSRILSALDDVPANVIPTAPSRGSALAPPRGRRTIAWFAKRQWRAAPWVTTIAAVLLAAIVLRTTRDAPDFAPRAAKMDSAQQVAQVALDSMQPRQTATRPALTPVMAPAQALPARASSASGGGALASTQSPRVMAREPQLAEAADRAALAVTDKAADDETRRRVALAPPPNVTAGIAKGVVGGVRPDELSARDFAGCYVLERGRLERGRLERAVTTVEAMAARAKTRAAASAAPTVTAAPVEEYVGPPGETLVRLDTMRGRPGFLVRSATSDSSLGWWRPVTRDSARADLYTAVFTLTPSKRVRCP